MPATQYPFIDIAVHERVRNRYAAGDAIVLFSADMSTVLWCNGRGAGLFGYGSVYDFLDQGPDQNDLLFRQVRSVASRVERSSIPETLTIRVAAGFRAVPVMARCMPIDLSGEAAVLFTAPVGGTGGAAAATGSGLIDGLDDPHIHVAVLGADGVVAEASKAFPTLGLTPHTAQMLVTIANSEANGLVKRPVPTSKGYLPAAMGKLSDDPALYLLLVVETAAAGMDLAPEAIGNDPAAAMEVRPRNADSFDDAIEAVAHIEETSDTEELVTLDVDSADSEENDASDEDRRALPPQGGEAEETTVTLPGEGVVDEAPTEPPTPSREEPPSEPRFVFRRDSRATRFVWKIDAEGRFQEISEEFARTVGPRSANIAGSTFADVSARFKLDPENKLQDLLRRRDTWSGKTIRWPVEGTSFKVPIDLAALPTYTRDRVFDGFRGFGIIRVGDVAEDPDALGISLASDANETRAEEAPFQEAEEVSSAVSDDVASGEVVTREGVTAPEEAAPQVEPAADAELDSELPEPSMTEAANRDAETDLQLPENEKPALRVVAAPAPASTDKVVQLPDRRIRREGLSPVEQAAFREIARQLDGFIGRRPSGDEDPSSQEVAGVNADEAQALPDTLEDTREVSPPSPEPESDDHLSSADLTVPDDAQEAPLAEEQPSAVEESEPDNHQSGTADDERAPYLPAARERMGLSGEILDQMPVALLVHAGDRLIHANPEFLRLTGYSSLEALADVGGLDALLQRQDLDHAANQASGLVLVRADDVIVPVTARLQSVRFEDATALMLAMIPIAADPVAEKEHRAEIIPLARPIPEQAARLQVEVEELRAILETATDGVVVIDMDGTIRSMNRAASALFNYDNDEAEGKPFVMLFAHESQKAIIDYLAGLSGHGVASVLNDGREVIGREASGGFIPLFMTIGRLTSSNGFCAVIRDVTQWKRTEEELRTAKRVAEAANAHKSEFLAHVSHEIRTPLNAIIGFADLMATEHFGPVGHPRYVEYASDIVRSGRHVLDIVNDLLDISKIEAGEMELDFIPVELNETVSEAVSLLQPQANGQRVIIRTALSHSVPQVVADLRSVKQIVLNILSNAIRFTPSGGQIVVSTAYEGNGSVVLRIRDTGIGMSREELEVAMKPFRQVAGSTRKRGDGTGLGLPLTKAMVDANRASFAISSAPREGTLVEITFPPQRVLAN
nr:histidine kinase [Rhizobium sp. TCK]